MNPVVTAISGWLGSLLAGAVFVEYIFGWNGLGKLTVQALENYDLPVVMGVVLLVSFIFILLNMLADMINAWLDPRIRIST
jgi:peptide/nickel transport system permease protein